MATLNNRHSEDSVESAKTNNGAPEGPAERLREQGQTSPSDIKSGIFSKFDSPIATHKLPGVELVDKTSAQAGAATEKPAQSLPVQRGEGYHQVIHRMYKDMAGDKVAELAREAKHINGGRNELKVGEQFMMPKIDERQADKPRDRSHSHAEPPKDPAATARDQRAEQTRRDFHSVDSGVNPPDGLDAGRHPVPDMRQVMGLSPEESGAVDKWLEQNPKGTLADAVGKGLDNAPGLHFRSPAQIEKDFADRGTMIKDNGEAWRQLAAFPGTAGYEDRLARAVNRDFGSAEDQASRQSSALSAFKQQPWGTVPKEELTGLPDDKVKMISDAKALGDPRPVEQIGMSMGHFDQKRADELSGTFKQQDFVHDRALKEGWQAKSENGADTGALVQRAEALWQVLGPTYDKPRQMTRPESALVGLHGNGSLSQADVNGLVSKFKGLDGALGPENLPATYAASPEKFTEQATRLLETRAKFTGEKTGPEALDAEKKRILGLNPGSGETPAAGADGKVSLYSDEQLQGWRQTAARNSLGLIGEVVKYNSGGKVNDDMIRRAEDLRAAYQKVDPKAGQPIGGYLKEMGVDPQLVESSFASQQQAKAGVQDIATRYNSEHPTRYTVPDVQINEQRNGSWHTVYEPVKAQGGYVSHYREMDLRELTLQKFFENPLKNGFAAAAVHGGGDNGRIFDVPQYNAIYKEQLKGLQEKFGDAYEKKYGRPLDRIYFGSLDTGSKVNGHARADICVKAGTAFSEEMMHLNSPDGRKLFTMRFLGQNGRPMTIDSVAEPQHFIAQR